MSRLTEGMSAGSALKIRAVSMLAILLMTMFAPAQGTAVLDPYCFECMSPLQATCGTLEACQEDENQSCQSLAPMHCWSVCGKYYTWQCVFEENQYCEDTGWWRICAWAN